MSSFLTIVAVIAILVFLNALYVVSEFASVKARKIRLAQMAEDGNAVAKVLVPMIADGKPIDNYVAACQIGITLSSLTLGAFGTRQIEPQIVALLSASGLPALADSAGTIAFILVLTVITVLQVVAGELVPKSLAIQRPERWALITTWPMKISIFLYTPLTKFFNGSGNLILSWFGFKGKEKHGHVPSPEELEILVEQSNVGGLLDDEERSNLLSEKYYATSAALHRRGALPHYFARPKSLIPQAKARAHVFLCH